MSDQGTVRAGATGGRAGLVCALVEPVVADTCGTCGAGVGGQEGVGQADGLRATAGELSGPVPELSGTSRPAGDVTLQAGDGESSSVETKGGSSVEE